MTMTELGQTQRVDGVKTKRRRGRPRKDSKLVRYSVLWLEPDVAEALTAECGSSKRTAVIRKLITEGLQARGRLVVNGSLEPTPDSSNSNEE